MNDRFTYKGQYHFTNKYGIVDKEHLPSVDAAPDINHTIKENPYVANAEVEKNEMVLDPDYAGLYKVVGKRHSEGGTPTYLKGGSFIYSDFKKMKLKEEDFEEMDMKYHKDMTPAEAVKKYVDPKKYNTIIANLSDPKADFITKNSSMLMLEKHLGSLGRIAYLQEKKKGFPEGLPAITENSAPVYDDNLKQELDMQKQYMKLGGLVKYQGGGELPSWLKPFAKANTQQGRVSPTGKDVTISSLSDNKIYDAYNKWVSLNNGKQFTNAAELQGFIYDHFEKNGKGRIDKMWTDWGNTNLGESGKYIPPSRQSFADGHLGKRTMELMLGILPEDEQLQPQRNTYSAGTIPLGKNIPKGLQIGKPNPTIVGKEDVNPVGLAEKEFDWEFTPWQKVNQAYNSSRLAGLKRYMPARARLNPSYMEESLMNPEQAVSDLKSGFSRVTDSSRVMNPILAAAQNTSAYGNYLDQAPQVRSQYDNNNVQIINNVRAQNNQIANNARAQNMQNDARYYQEAITGLSNFDNMKGLLRDRYMEGVMQDVVDNQTLAYMQATERDPAWKFDYRTGNYSRLPKSILNGYSSQQSQLDPLEQILYETLQAASPAERVSLMMRSGMLGRSLFNRGRQTRTTKQQ